MRTRIVKKKKKKKMAEVKRKVMRVKKSSKEYAEYLIREAGKRQNDSGFDKFLMGSSELAKRDHEQKRMVELKDFLKSIQKRVIVTFLLLTGTIFHCCYYYPKLGDKGYILSKVCSFLPYFFYPAQVCYQELHSKNWDCQVGSYAADMIAREVGGSTNTKVFFFFFFF